MRKLNLLAAASIAAMSITAATPAFADVQQVSPSDANGTLVHGNGGAADVGTEVTGDLGSGPTQQTNFVHFTGSTTATVSTTDANDVMLQGGAGQAELTGAILSGQNTYDLQSGNIFLTGNAGIEYIELAFGDVTSDTITFIFSLLGESDQTLTLDTIHTDSGESRYAFEAINGESITNLFYQFNGGVATDIRQVRIATLTGPNAAVPEPATWAMMLIGFGAAGVAMRRNRRKVQLAQIA